VTYNAGGLDLLTIAAIFLVVFTAMWGGVQHSRGELLPAQEVDASERQLRDVLWVSFAEWRRGEGLEPPRRVAEVTGDAQAAAVRFADGNRSVGTTDETSPPATGPHLTGNDRCSQLLVRHTTAQPGWPGGTAERVDDAVARAVADELLAALLAADDAGLLERAGEFRTGVGVAARGDRIYAAFHSCARRRLP
jgi:hypothetical protein